jgi:hypothetical protein
MSKIKRKGVCEVYSSPIIATFTLDEKNWAYLSFSDFDFKAWINLFFYWVILVNSRREILVLSFFISSTRSYPRTYEK